MKNCHLALTRKEAGRGIRDGKKVFSLAGILLTIVALQPVLAGKPPRVEKPSHVAPGTVIPVRLVDEFEVSSARTQQKIEMEVMQAVPLAGKQKIELRARVVATVVSVDKSGDGPVRVSLKLDQLEEKSQTTAIAASVRAIASYQAVRNAQVSKGGADAGTPAGWGTTVQIGGDIRYGDGGKVRNRQKQTVGKGLRGGVLVHLAANEELGCDGPGAGGDPPQATWVFSADACGVYDLKNVKITHNGRTDPIGVITLEFAKEDAKLNAGTAFLVRTVKQP